MTDDPTVPTDHDARDERVAELLAVPPLDDLTRRRLVRSALAAADEAPSPRRSRSRLSVVVPVAAAILVGVVVGAVIVQRPSDDTPTAAQPASSVPAPQDAERAAEADDTAPAVSPAPAVAPESLGNLGIVDDDEDLRIAVSLAEGQPAGPAAGTAAEAACGTTDPASLGLTAVTALGTALFDDQPVIVLVGTNAEGRRRAIALGAACTPVLQTQLD